MAYIPDHVIDSAISAILATRDFVGTLSAQKEAALDALHDGGVHDQRDLERALNVAFYRANSEWRRCQRAAGVPEKYIGA